MSDDWVDVESGGGGGDEWVDVGSNEPWNIIGAAKQFGSGLVEGLTGTGALVADVLQPENRIKLITDRMFSGQPPPPLLL
jgi:hypothetical protein